MFWKKKKESGEVIEVQTSHGFAYAQCIHDSPQSMYKGFQVMRMIEGFHKTRPSDLVDLMNKPTLFYFHFLLKHEIKKGFVKLAGKMPIPAQEQAFPVFRSGLPDPKNDYKMVGGLLIQGSKERFVEKFAPDDLKLSFNEIWNSHSLKDSLEIGWRPELDISSVGESKCTLIAAAETMTDEEAGGLGSTKNQDRAMTHYLYFKTRQKAEPAIQEIKSKGFRVEDQKSADGKDWLVLAFEETKNGVDIGKSRDFFEGIAHKFKGEYDGWEADVSE